MTDNEKQHMLDRLNEVETMLHQMNDIVLDLIDGIVERAEPEEVTPESDERESLPDDTPVGHGWVVDEDGYDLFKPHSQGRFTRWWNEPNGWGIPGSWCESELNHLRPATVGDLRRVGLPITEWPDITAPEPKPEVEPEEVTSESDEEEDPYPDWEDGDPHWHLW